MMKRFIVFMLLILAVAVYFGVDPPEAMAQAAGDGPRWYHAVKDTITVDSAIGGNWKPIDSMVVVLDDSGLAVIHFQAQATFNPTFGGLYVGLGNDSANRVSAATAATTGQTHTNFDTAYFYWPGDIKNSAPMTVSYVWFDTSRTAGGKTDTFYINCATRATHTRVSLENVRVWVDVILVDSL